MNKFLFDSMKFLVNFFSPKMHFFNFRMNHTFLGVAFDAPFDLSWGSRRLISFTYQKQCFMTISRFRFFFKMFVNIFADGRAYGRSDGRTDGRTDGRSDGRSDGRTVGRTERNLDVVYT